MLQVPKRLAREIAEVSEPDVAASGLFYSADEVNALKGQGLVIGPPGTPYAFCPLVFDFVLPSSYPFDPPKVLIKTSNGITRFHPNLYVGGKVCLSILGTWEGPKWCAVMTIRTVLTSIQALLDENPIANEPGYSKYTKDCEFSKNYSAVVQFMLTAHCFKKFLAWKKGSIDPEWKRFEDVFAERGEAWLQGLWGIICAEAAKGDKTYPAVAYSMSCHTEWLALKALGIEAGLKA